MPCATDATTPDALHGARREADGLLRELGQALRRHPALSSLEFVWAKVGGGVPAGSLSLSLSLVSVYCLYLSELPFTASSVLVNNTSTGKGAGRQAEGIALHRSQLSEVSV